MVGGGLAAEPDVPEGLFGRGAAVRVRLQEAGDEVFGVFADVFPVPLVEDDARRFALFDQVGEAFAPEGRVAAEEGVCDDAEGPHVDGFAVALLQHYFGGGVAEGACHRREDSFVRVEHLGDAEVGEDEGGVGFRSEV